MPGLTNALVTGQNFSLKTDVAVADVEEAAGATPTKAEFDAVVTAINSLLAQLRANGLVIAPTEEE